MTEFFCCPECDHEHEIEIIRGEYPSDDYSELPETCEACGASFEFSGVDEQAHERRQMGIE